MWRSALPLIAAVGAYLITVVGIAGLGQLQLVGAVHDWPPFDLLAILLVAPMLIASGQFPARVLHAFRIRSPYAYIANTVISAYLGFWAFLFNFSVADGMGALLEKIPKNGHDFEGGLTLAVPPFAPMLESAFAGIIHIRLRVIWYLGFVLVAALIIAWASNWQFWRGMVLPAADREVNDARRTSR